MLALSITILIRESSNQLNSIFWLNIIKNLTFWTWKKFHVFFFLRLCIHASYFNYLFYSYSFFTYLFLFQKGYFNYFVIVLNHIQDGTFGKCSLKSVTHIRQWWDLPKDQKHISIMPHTFWVLLTSTFLHQQILLYQKIQI